MFSRFFAVIDDFVAQTKQYGYADKRPMVLLVVGLVVVLFVAGLVPALQQYHGFVAEDAPRYAYPAKWLFPIFVVSGVWFALKKRGQNIASVGFTTKNIWKSLALGAIIFVPLLAYNLALGARPSEAFFEADAGYIIYRVTYFLIGISLSEELLFRGYLGTRLYGLMDNKGKSIFRVGLLFAIMHYIAPFPGFVLDAGPLFFPPGGLLQLLWYIPIHAGFHWLYAKYNNIAGPLLLHTLVNSMSIVFN